MDKQRIRAVGLGMAGSGAILGAISMLVEDGYWFLVTGTVFVLIGIIMMYFGSRLAG